MPAQVPRDLAGPGDEPERPRAVRMTGRVEAGVEHGSVLLVADGSVGRGEAVYQLGAAGAHAVGRRVALVARTVPGLLTTAQQGEPVEVVELTVLD